MPKKIHHANRWRSINPILPLTWYEKSATDVAPRLLGCVLVRKSRAGVVVGRIVETEAYLGPHDPASHAYHGPTPRNAVMFGPAGRAYIYFTYGLHHCLNVVTGSRHNGQAVLIRALEPLVGLALMKKRRGLSDLHQLTNGPAKLTEALNITRADNGRRLSSGLLSIHRGWRLRGERIQRSRRVGISQGRSQLYRFYLKGNPCLSR